MLVFLQLSLSRQPAFIGNFPLHVYGSRARVAWWSTSKSLQGWFILSPFFFFFSFFSYLVTIEACTSGGKKLNKKRRKELCRLLSLECLLDNISVADLMGNQFYFILFLPSLVPRLLSFITSASSQLGLIFIFTSYLKGWKQPY